MGKNLGYVQKRSRTDPAVVRYARFSVTKNPEKYYQSILQLFLPYRTDVQLKPVPYQSFQDFYQSGSVKYDKDNLQTVKVIVNTNKSHFEKEANEIDKAEQLLQSCGALEDAWAQIHPETEMERNECLQEMHNNPHITDEDNTKRIPDLFPTEKRICTTQLAHHGLSKIEAQSLMRSMNEKQSNIFYVIRQWCLDTRNGNNPAPFHVFVTGGAGTGKSHLIKAICYEASRILAHISQNPDDTTVLLTAPTGVAAYNIGATTIHSTLSIGIKVSLPYCPLSEEKNKQSTIQTW